MKTGWKHLSSRFFPVAVPTKCVACGAKLDPYVPTCSRCGRREASRVKPAVTEKPTGFTRIGHLTDLHLGKKRTLSHGAPPEYQLKAWLQLMGTLETDGVTISGDLIENPGDLSTIDRAFEILKNSGLPTFVVPGNHDVNLTDIDRHFHEYFGPYPRVEVVGSVEIILFDSLNGLRRHERNLLEKGFALLAVWTEGAIGENQYADASRLLQNRSAESRLIVVHHHVHPQPPERIFGRIDDETINTMRPMLDGHRMIEWAKQHSASTLVHGHKHSFMQPGVTDGLLILNGGSSTHGAQRNRARVVDFGPGGDRWIHELQLNT